MFMKLFVEWPLRAIVGITEKIAEHVDRELDRETRIKKEMVRLNMLFEEGQIDEDQYEAAEQFLLQQLEILESEKGAS